MGMYAYLLGRPEEAHANGRRSTVARERADAMEDAGDPGDLPAMMAKNRSMPDPEQSELPISGHEISAQLPPDTTAITADGEMENHRKPIVSINGKDVPAHEEGRERAA